VIFAISGCGAHFKS